PNSSIFFCGTLPNEVDIGLSFSHTPTAALFISGLQLHRCRTSSSFFPSSLIALSMASLTGATVRPVFPGEFSSVCAFRTSSAARLKEILFSCTGDGEEDGFGVALGLSEIRSQPDVTNTKEINAQ